jgi:hypothetical protein
VRESLSEADKLWRKVRGGPGAAESFYFVTNREDAPAAIVEHYLDWGEAQRRFRGTGHNPGD